MEPKRILVVGCGAMSRAWIKHVQGRSDAVIAGLCDLSLAAAQKRAKDEGLDCPVFDDLARALDRVAPDVVFDITIPQAHRQVVTAALAKGCPVFGEKPMAGNLADAKAMVAAAEAAGKPYAVMQNRRYLKGIRALRGLIAAGAIGEPSFITADFFIGAHFGGFRDEMENPLLVDMAIHTFDQARFITGADAVEVSALAFNPKGSWYRGDAAALCQFRFANGALFSYRGSWCAEGANTSWEAAWRVCGTRGTAIWDGGPSPWADVVAKEEGFTRPTSRVEAPKDWAGREGHEGCLDALFQSLSDGKPPETDCRDNVKSVAMVFAAVESARQGGAWVKVG
ncbi:MAG: Gfo/Idh/MocA family oxidoreductase [Spirochaetes bacterium]|nr:Gfo/Idh/MocA family oxidoreductase [Spirochaetota bacterium]